MTVDEPNSPGVVPRAHQLPVNLQTSDAAFPPSIIEVLDQVSDAVALKDGERRLRYVNRAFASMVGRSSQSLLGLEDSDYLEDVAAVIGFGANDRAVLETGQTESYAVQAWICGELRTLNIRKSPFRDGDGAICGVLLVAKDFSESTRAATQTDEDLRRREAELALIYAHILESIALWRVDPAGRFQLLRVNATEAVPKEIIAQVKCGHYLDEFVSPEFAEPAKQLFLSAVRDQTPKTIEDVFPTAIGPRAVHCVLIPILDQHGSCTHLLSVTSDVTEQQQARARLVEQEQQLAHMSRLTMMGELVAGIAHEINQPLNAIGNFAKACEVRIESAAAATADRHDISELNRSIQESVVRAGEIIRRLKMFFRRSATSRQPERIENVVTESVEMLGFLLRDARISLEMQLDKTGQPVSVDRVQIQQVIINLLKNAADALLEQPPNQPRRILITTSSTANEVVVSVFDNAAGLDPGTRDHVFDPYFTTKQDGLGTGLAISKSLIESHHGRIWCEPNPPSGTVFRFCLPRGT